MILHTHRSAELPAPPERLQQLLAATPPFGAIPLGQLWQWLDELWTIDLRRFDDGRLVWQARCSADPRRRALITATLQDAGIATQLQLHVALEQPGRSMLGLAAKVRQRRVAAAVERALAQLRRTLTAAAPTEPAELPREPAALAAALRSAYPATVAAFEQMDALGDLAAVARLDQRWQATEGGAVPPDVYAEVAELPPVKETFDLIYAGGGLGLLHAAVMARRGCRVLLFDRGTVGCAHREWNISDRELQAFVHLDLFTPDEIETVVMRRYTDGVVRFYPDGAAVRPAELRMQGVLNVAIDAARLLRLARRKLEAAGGRVLDQRAFVGVSVAGPGKVAVAVRREDGTAERWGGRLLMDGMGATSPLALRRFAGQPFAGVCPTVGTVVTGLERGSEPTQHNPEVGDILVSVADAQRGRQLIWEGFAGRGDELTVYVFYYDVLEGRRQKAEGRRQKAEDVVRSLSSFIPHPSSFRPHSLLELFEDYFRLLPSYKRPGPAFQHVKPVYGFIPARHTVRRQGVPLLPGVLPLGDSSAQQSPLTFCGFGSHVRNLQRTTGLLHYALEHDLLAPHFLGQISAYQANVALNWVFSRFMQPWDRPSDVNRLQNIFARVLNEVGVDIAVRFFQDQMTWRDYGRIVNHTLAVYKPIIPTALRVLGVRECGRWIADWLRFSAEAGAAALGRAAGDPTLDAVERGIAAWSPGLRFELMARRAEWRAMGWDRHVESAPAPILEQVA